MVWCVANYFYSLFRAVQTMKILVLLRHLHWLRLREYSNLPCMYYNDKSHSENYAALSGLCRPSCLPTQGVALGYLRMPLRGVKLDLIHDQSNC